MSEPRENNVILNVGGRGKAHSVVAVVCVPEKGVEHRGPL